MTKKTRLKIGEFSQLMQVSVKTLRYYESLPEIIVASHREVIPDYAAIGPMCVEKIGPEMQRLGCKCPPHLHPRPDVEVQRGTLEVPRKWRRRETKSTHVKQSLFLWLSEDDIIAHLRPTFMHFLRQTAITL